MRLAIRAAGLLTALSFLPALALADAPPAVTVEFVKPESFSDVEDRRTRVSADRNPALRAIREHLEDKALAYLAPGQSLLVRFTDIDLAGEYEPSADLRWADVRIVKRVYPPRLKFDYQLSDIDGVTLAEGSTQLRDLGFLEGNTGRQQDPLLFEKRLLDRWLRETLTETAAVAGLSPTR